MAPKLRFLLALVPALVFGVPAVADNVNENDLGLTLQALRNNLSKDYDKRVAADKSFDNQYRAQRREMIATMKKCNELAILLYSQKQDFTFDLTYALESVTREYDDYMTHRLPYDRIVGRLDWDIERYARLVESLRRIPPEVSSVEVLPDSLAYRNRSIDSLDRARWGNRTPEEIQRLRAAIRERMRSDSTNTDRPFSLSEEESANRDSCLLYASELLKLSAKSKARIISDSTHYQRSYLRLKESYDYAQTRYVQLQNRIFVQGQTAYPSILKRFGSYWRMVSRELKEKYDFANLDNVDKETITFNSASRGPLLVSFLLIQLLSLGLSILVISLLFRLLARVVKPLQKVPQEQRIGYILLISVIICGLLTFLPSKTSNFIVTSANLIGTYLWLLAAVIAALLVRLKPKSLHNGLKLYRPLLIAAIVVISLRVVFMPNTTMNVLFPPILLLFSVWQLIACFKHGNEVPDVDRTFGWITFFVFALSLGVSFFGYIFFALIIMVWWFFQMAIIHTVATLSHLLEQFREKRMPHMISEYKKRLTFLNASDRDGLIFGATWMYDLIKSVILPVLALQAIPLCIRLSLEVFDFSDLYNTIYNHPFVNLTNAEGVTGLRLSFRTLVTASCLFFVFRYINYALTSIFQVVKYKEFLKANGRSVVRKNEVNLSLGKSVINTLVWFVYIVMVVIMVKLPTSSLTIIAGGLSAGIGIALKDIINNIIYGVQLMSGRLRVGDWIICDGVRGKVTKIGYQSTEIETIEGAVLSYLNANLFAKNFSNLTRYDPYEFIKIVVGVPYGTDVEKVRGVLEEAMQEMRTKDSYNRDVVEPRKGIWIAFEDFGDSSVNIAVKQNVLVAEHIAYCDRAREVIYNALDSAGINIPFPQRDIHIISGAKE